LAEETGMTDDDKKFVAEQAEVWKSWPDVLRLCRIIRELKASNTKLQRELGRKYAEVANVQGDLARYADLRAEIANAPWVYGRWIAGTFHQLCVHSPIYEHSCTHRAPLLTSRMEKL